MPQFSEQSKNKLETCHRDLQVLFNEVIKYYDCSILGGHRTQLEQNEKFRLGLSKKQYPNSNHNALPSNAVDVAPYPIDWDDRERFSYFAGFVEATAILLKIKIRWGGDWDSDHNLKNNNFDDLPHFELVD